VSKETACLNKALQAISLNSGEFICHKYTYTDVVERKIFYKLQKLGLLKISCVLGRLTVFEPTKQGHNIFKDLHSIKQRLIKYRELRDSLNKVNLKTEVETLKNPQH